MFHSVSCPCISLDILHTVNAEPKIFIRLAATIDIASLFGNPAWKCKRVFLSIKSKSSQLSMSCLVYLYVDANLVLLHWMYAIDVDVGRWVWFRCRAIWTDEIRLNVVNSQHEHRRSINVHRSLFLSTKTTIHSRIHYLWSHKMQQKKIIENSELCSEVFRKFTKNTSSDFTLCAESQSDSMCFKNIHETETIHFSMLTLATAFQDYLRFAKPKRDEDGQPRPSTLKKPNSWRARKKIERTTESHTPYTQTHTTCTWRRARTHESIEFFDSRARCHRTNEGV